MARNSLPFSVHLFFYLAVLVAGGLFTYWGVNSIFFSPVNPSAQKTSFIVEKGWGLSVIADKLKEAKLIKSVFAFKLLGKFEKDKTKKGKKELNIFPGEYSVSAAMTPKEIIAAFKNREVVYHTVTIPEGFTSKEIAMVLAGTGLVTKAEVDTVLQDRNLVRNYAIPENSLEGYLYPETYKFTRPDDANVMVRKMLDEGAKHRTAEFLNRSSELELTYHQVLTLASIIEKETGLASERETISSVFHNRLRSNMPLQSDPTVIYGIPNFDGDLKRHHLKTPTPYNTYINPGLPPTPIANPGIESIKAALYPADTEFLYFVSKGDGSHVFSKTYREHKNYVNKYQRGKHQLKDPKPKAKPKAKPKPKPKPKAKTTPKIITKPKPKSQLLIKKDKPFAPKRPKKKNKDKKPISQLDFE